MLLALAVFISCVLAGVEVDLFVPSLPELQRVFNVSPFLVQLTLSVNFVAYCICSLFAGALGDRFGPRKVTIYGLTIFNIGSIACVLFHDFYFLLLGRFLQGIGIAAPAVLSYVVITDKYPKNKQIALLAYINGLQTFAMATAPVLGSYINYYFGWKWNFATLLLLGLICQFLWFFVEGKEKTNSKVSISLGSYIPLLRSFKLSLFVLILSLIACYYWTFVGMASILYVDGFKVNLTDYGYYQGAITLSFGILSLISPFILNIVSRETCMKLSMYFFVINSFALLFIAVQGINKPLIITTLMVFSAIAAVFPITILYPYSLDIVPGAKSRAAALNNAVKLLFTALGVEIVSYFYNGTYFAVGIFSVICILLSVACYFVLISNFPNALRSKKEA